MKSYRVEYSVEISPAAKSTTELPGLHISAQCSSAPELLVDWISLQRKRLSIPGIHDTGTAVGGTYSEMTFRGGKKTLSFHFSNLENTETI